MIVSLFFYNMIHLFDSFHNDKKMGQYIQIQIEQFKITLHRNYFRVPIVAGCNTTKPSKRFDSSSSCGMSNPNHISFPNGQLNSSFSLDFFFCFRLLDFLRTRLGFLSSPSACVAGSEFYFDNEKRTSSQASSCDYFSKSSFSSSSNSWLCFGLYALVAV